MDGGVSLIFWFIASAVALAIFGVVGAIWYGVWATHRERLKALEILKSSAERGAEPSAEILSALTPHGGGSQQGAGVRPASRAAHLEQFIFGVSLAGAATGVAWWRNSDGGGPEWLVYASVIAAVVLGAGSIARLIAALSTPPNNG